GAKPAPRWQHAIAVEGTGYPVTSTSLIVYGGQDASGAALGDVWELPLGQPTPTWHHWQPVGSEAVPPPRWAHTPTGLTCGSACPLAPGGFVALGGCDGAGVRSDDAWELFVPPGSAQCDTTFTEHLWLALPSSGTPRYDHVATETGLYGLAGSSLFLTVLMHGGIGADGQPIDGSQVRALFLGGSRPPWSTKILPGGPSARSGPAATWEAHGLTWTLHGGKLADGSLSNDVWVLDFKQRPDPTWTYYPQTGGPGGRWQHTLVFDGRVNAGEVTHLVDARIPELFNP